MVFIMAGQEDSMKSNPGIVNGALQKPPPKMSLTP